MRDIKDIIQARTGDIIEFITATIEGSGFNGYLAKGIVLTGGTVAIDGISEQIVRSGYLVRKELPIEIKGLREAFYSDAVVTGIFLEDMEREYRRFIERASNQDMADESTEETAKEIETNEDDLDDILNEDTKEKKGIWQLIKEFF